MRRPTGSDEKSLSEELLEHEEFVRAIVRQLLSDGSRVDDVVQETLLRALQKPPRARSALKAWLARVARNIALTIMRREKRLTRRQKVAARPEGVCSTADTVGRAERMHQVLEAVMGLKEPHRTTVLEHFYERLTVAQIAERRGISGTAVRKRVSRAMEMLRESLDEKYGGNRGAWCLALLPLVAPLALDGVPPATGAAPQARHRIRMKSSPPVRPPGARATSRFL